MTVPDRIAVAGDWHGNMRWATQQIARIGRDVLKDEPRKIILHAGDFGIWPGKPGKIFLDSVEAVLELTGAELWFVDGNHEDFDQLLGLQAMSKSLDPLAPVQVRKNISWLPRGCRWTWHGRKWLAFGGAVSIDQDFQRKRETWWPQEKITIAQITAAAHGGPADVMLCHDCPSEVILSLPVPPPEWLKFVTECEENRRALQLVVDDTKPQHLIHGHYHMAYQKPVVMPYGLIEVTGLDKDGEPLNWLVLDVKTMKWEVPER